MSSNAKALEQAILALNPLEQAELLRMLADTLQNNSEPEVKQLWIAEAQQRRRPRYWRTRFFH
jgi:hypothetical protein